MLGNAVSKRGFTKLLGENYSSILEAIVFLFRRLSGQF